MFNLRLAKELKIHINDKWQEIANARQSFTYLKSLLCLSLNMYRIMS